MKQGLIRAAAAVTGRLLLLALVCSLLPIGPRSALVAEWLRAGDAALKVNQPEVALLQYQRILGKGEPATPEIYERLITAARAAGEPALAQVYLLALADRDGWNDERRMMLVSLLRATENSDLAATIDRSLLARNQDDPRALVQLALQQIEALDWIGLEQTLLRWTELEPTSPRAAYWLGLLYAPQDQSVAQGYLVQAGIDPARQAAVHQLQTALTGYQTLALTDAHTALGIALVSLGEWAFAERAFDYALAANSINPMALAYRGFVRDRQGRNGLPDLEAARAMVPNKPVVHYLLGFHWRLNGAHSRAQDAFTQAYWLAGENPAYAVEVGASLQNLGELAEAETWYWRAVELSPENSDWKRPLAAFYADTGYNLELRGLAFIESAHAGEPNDADVRASLGWAYFQLGDVERAHQELDVAVGQNPASVRSRYFLAAVLEKLGNVAAARDSYSFVVQAAESGSRYGVLAARALQRLN